MPHDLHWLLPALPHWCRNELDDEDVPHLPMTDKQRRRLNRQKAKEREERRKQKDGTAMDESDGEFETVPTHRTVGWGMATQFKDTRRFGGTRPETKPKEMLDFLWGEIFPPLKPPGGKICPPAKPPGGTICPPAKPEKKTLSRTARVVARFTQDEAKCTKPELPVSKELMDECRRKLREINARPIRKVAEAMARKKKRMSQRLAKVRKTAAVLADQEDIATVRQWASVPFCPVTAGKMELFFGGGFPPSETPMGEICPPEKYNKMRQIC
eukprot:gene116-45_t